MAKGHESQREETLSIFTIPSGGEDYSKSVSRGKGLGTVLAFPPEFLRESPMPPVDATGDYPRESAP